jgi:uncharacterized protein (DUF433 family)
MTMTIHADPVPLRVAEGGAIRVGNTRIPLDRIVEEYERGTTPEAMVHSYDVLDLADVYAAIAYYLRHRADVAAYLQRREQEAAEIRQKIETEMPLPPGFKEELNRRWAERESSHAPPRQ